MAVRTPGEKVTGMFRSYADARSFIDSVPFMALQAEKWFAYLQQVRVNRSVGKVTIHAILQDICMLKQERALLFRMALNAGVLDCILLQ